MSLWGKLWSFRHISNCGNWRQSRTKWSLWCSHLSRLESLVFWWLLRVYGGSCNTFPFLEVSKQVVTSFSVAGMALCDIPTCSRMCRKFQIWRKSRTNFSFFCAHVSRLESLVFLWRRRVYGGSSALHTLHFTLHICHFRLHTLHSALYTLHSTLYTPHFTLYTQHSTLYTLHFTLRTLHFTLYTLHSTLYTLHSTLYTLQTPHSTLLLHTLHSTLYTFHSTLCTPHSTLHTPHSTLSTPHSRLYTPHSTICTLDSSLHTLHFTLHTLHFALYIPHSTLYTPHFTLYTPHSTLYTLHFQLRTLHFTLYTLHFTSLYTLDSTLYTLQTPQSSLHTPHFTLHTLHSTLSTPHSTLHTPHFTLHTPHSALYTLHFTLPTPHSTLQLYTPHFPLHTPHSTLYTLHTLHSPLHTSHSTLYTLHALHSPFLTLHSTLLTADSTLYTLHSTLHTPHSTLFTFHSTLQTSNRGNMYKTVQINYCRKVFCVTAYPCLSTSVRNIDTYVWAFGFVGCILFTHSLCDYPTLLDSAGKMMNVILSSCQRTLQSWSMWATWRRQNLCRISTVCSGPEMDIHRWNMMKHCELWRQNRSLRLLKPRVVPMSTARCMISPRGNDGMCPWHRARPWERPSQDRILWYEASLTLHERRISALAGLLDELYQECFVLCAGRVSEWKSFRRQKGVGFSHGRRTGRITWIYS